MTNETDEILARIDALKDEALAFFQGFTRIDTYNPPGDTKAGADFIAGFLRSKGIAFQTVAPQPTMPNIVATKEFARPGRHLVLNGHIDVFPPGDPKLWSHDPLSGAIVDGAVFGRGTADMKCGTTASIFTYLLLHGLDRELGGKMTLTVVSDEETGGRWGTEYLMEHHGDEVLGDCVLNGEPSSPWTVRFGEKSPIWCRFRIRTAGAHGAYPHKSKSATKIAARLMLDLETLEELTPNPPAAVARVLEGDAVREAIERGLGAGAVEVLKSVTVSFGLIEGGVKVNMIPGSCTLDADIRMPVGVTGAQIRAEVRRVLERYPEVEMEETQHTVLDPICSDPEHEMLGLIQDNAERLSGFRPVPIVTLGGTDCRFWRNKGVPAFVFGCSPGNMGTVDESVPLDEFFLVLRTHALSAYQYLRGPAPAGA